ncbi:hypothetical protein D9M70_524180 [compost metagenome]
MPVGFVIAQHPIIGDIRPDDIASGREIGRPLCPAAARIELLHPGAAVDQAGKALVHNLEILGHGSLSCGNIAYSYAGHMIALS